ncbi:MAG: hypothetical protein AAGF15_00505 [Pseudomonadota bacterium]
MVNKILSRVIFGGAILSLVAILAVPTSAQAGARSRVENGVTITYGQSTSEAALRAAEERAQKALRLRGNRQVQPQYAVTLDRRFRGTVFGKQRLYQRGQIVERALPRIRPISPLRFR